jgi:uncharacterized protein
MRKFIGRESEIQELNRLYRAKEAKLAVIYGRRRVGKSSLMEQFMADKKHLRFEGLEHLRTKDQIAQFMADLSRQVGDPLLGALDLENWSPVFDYLTRFFSQQNKKYVIFFDEFQWLAANQTKLVSLLKKYWDVHWSRQNIMLVLCGSVSSYMVSRVIKSKAFYGRINLEICLQALSSEESFKLLDGKRDIDEILRYSLILGGIPKYLNEIDPNQSFDQNMNRLFFTKNAVFFNEYERIFYSQFKEYKIYEGIVRYLKDTPRSLEEIAAHLKISSGGGVKSYLENLEQSLFITHYVPYDKSVNSKLKKYKLTDEYLRFYFKYIEPNKKIIAGNTKRNLFDLLVKSHWNSWLGFSFENFCLKNAMHLAELMGFSEQVLQWGPYFHRRDHAFQIDLVYLRADKVVTICEIKYHNEPITVTVIREVERKRRLLTIPRGYTVEKALISRFGPDAALQKLDYFHHFLQGIHLFKV